MNSALKIVPAADGRTVHATLDIWLTHPDPAVVGDVDVGMEIGKGLVREAVMLLKSAAEKEGFSVDAKFKQVVY